MTIGACLLLLAGLGLVDHAIGFEISVSVFYLLPISIAAWYVGAGAGTGLALASAAVWGAVDYVAGHRYSHPAIPVWNALVHLAFYLVTVRLLASLQAHVRLEGELARTDSLTGLMNARAFRESAAVFFQLAARRRRPIAVGYIDLDDFKQLNDSRGHTEADRALTQVGAMLSLGVRRSDLVARIGGDEFAVLLTDSDLGGASVLFGKLHDRLVEMARQERWPIGFSLGVAVFEEIPATIDDALHAADSLMYRVKGEGKNAVCYEVLGRPPVAHAG